MELKVPTSFDVRFNKINSRIVAITKYDVNLDTITNDMQNVPESHFMFQSDDFRTIAAGYMLDHMNRRYGVRCTW